MSAVIRESAHGFRPARRADIETIYRIECAAYDFPWSRRLLYDCLDSNYYFSLLIEQNRVVGYGIMSCVLDEAHLLNICIDPAWQGKGRGKKMLFHLLDVARRQRVTMAFLEVRLSNTVAQNLYEANGFNQIDIRKDYYPNGGQREDAIVYARVLGHRNRPNPPA